MRLVTRSALIRIAVLTITVIILLIGFWFNMIRMPLSSYRGSWTPLNAEEIALRDTLQRHVAVLANDIGERNISRHKRLQAAADFIAATMAHTGYKVNRYPFTAWGKTCENLEMEVRGRKYPGQIVVIGAHYDSVSDCPGANDNASSVAALLFLARSFSSLEPARTVRFVAFPNEEPPFFQTPIMGSLVYAQQCRKRNDSIVAMLSLETIGYYVDAEGSQKYPFPVGMFYPSRGNFIAFVGNLTSRGLVQKSIASFRRHAKFPSEGAALPAVITGIGWSDHWSFWQVGYPALMVTDTAPFRYPYYHTPQDTPDKLVYDRMARVIMGLEKVIQGLAND